MTLAFAALAALAGCATWQDIERGQSRAEVLARFGPPTSVVALLPNALGAEASAAGSVAVERLQYSGQPFGQFANMVDLDANGRVVRAFNALNVGNFRAIAARAEQTRTTRDDVLREFGPPAVVTAVSSWQGPIWLYRYYDSTDMRYALYFDPEGVLRRGHPEMEERRRRFPMY